VRVVLFYHYRGGTGRTKVVNATIGLQNILIPFLVNIPPEYFLFLEKCPTIIYFSSFGQNPGRLADSLILILNKINCDCILF
jgi:hypothetical protein